MTLIYGESSEVREAPRGPETVMKINFLGFNAMLAYKPHFLFFLPELKHTNF